MFPCTINKHLSKVCWQSTKGLLSINKSSQKCETHLHHLPSSVFIWAQIRMFSGQNNGFTMTVYLKQETTRCNSKKIHTMTLTLGWWYTEKNHKAVNRLSRTGATNVMYDSQRHVNQRWSAHTHTVQRTSLISQVTDNAYVGARWPHGVFNILRTVSALALKWDDTCWIYTSPAA